MSEIKMNLWQKISQVMKDVEYLSKDDQIKFGTTAYKAISEEKVTSTVRDSLIKNGLVILPVEQQHSKVDNLSTVDVKYKIVNIDNPQEYEFLVSSGTGVDTQDKGVGKAMTYSYKYMLLRTFAIPTGEDPDKISSAELDEKLNSSKTPKNASQSTETDGQPNTLAKDKIDAIKALAKKKGITEKYICDVKKVNSFAELSLQQWQDAMNWLEKKEDKAVKAS